MLTRALHAGWSPLSLIALPWLMLLLVACGDAGQDQASNQVPPDAATGEAAPDAPEPTTDAEVTEDAAQPDAADAGPPSPYRVPDTPPFANPTFGDEPGVIFRWRADGVSTSPGVLSEGLEEVTTERPEPFSSFRYVAFDPPPGSASGYLGESPIATQPTGFTVQAWFRARSLDGTRTLFSNTGANRGLCFDVKDGYLQVALSTSDAGSPYRHWVRDASTPLQTDRWYHATVSASLRTDHWRVAFFVDGEPIHEQTLPFDHGSALVHSTERPAVAAEPGAGGLEGEAFDGDIHAVVVHNYPLGDDVLGTRQLREGGRYFGTPSYHDYLKIPEPAGTAGASPPYSDRKYNFARRVALTNKDRRFDGLRPARVRLGLPFLNDRYVPSGVAVSGDGRTLWMGFHFVHDEGGNPDGNGTFVAEIDLPSYEVRSVYRLQDVNGTAWTRAAGGMTWAPGGLYLTLGNRVVRFETSRANLETPPDPDLPGSTSFYTLQATDVFEVRVSDAAIAYDAEYDALWLGGHTGSAIDRYDLSPEGAIERPSSTSSDEQLALPASVAFVRGVTRLPVAGERCFLLTSYDLGDVAGAHASRLFRWCEGRPAAAARLDISGAAQALALGPDGTVWVLPQSGSRHLQKRTQSRPWYDVLTPYLLGYDASEFDPATVGCRTEAMSAWLGDLHTHTSYSDGTGLPAEMFALARDTVGLDFLFVTDHVEKLTADELSKCRAAAKSATKPAFLGFCGFEISTKSPDGDRLGHANILFPESMLGPSTSLAGLYDKIAACDGCLAQINHPASEDYPWTGDQVAAKVDSAMALAELNGATQVAARARYFELLDGGWHVAPSWNSDTHAMDPAKDGRRTGLFATSLEEASIAAAIAERRTFAGNTGNGGSLALDAEGCWMGVRLQGFLTATFHVRAVDAATGFSSVTLRSVGGTDIHTFDCAGQTVCEATATLDVDPAQRYVVAYATRTDGKWMVSAPVWIED
jgi:hypothetical protein